MKNLRGRNEYRETDRVTNREDLEFYGEATYGEAFLVSPSNSEESAKAQAFFVIILLVFIMWLIRRDQDPKTTRRLPATGEFLLYFFLPMEDRDFVIGDFMECYHRLLHRFGKRQADIWFYKQVIGSLWPLLRRAILKIGALVWLGRILRRLIS